MTNRYFHSGQLGDIVYALLTVKELGPGAMVTSLRKDRHDQLEPLLRLQPYITDVEHFAAGRPMDWAAQPPDITHDLNAMRRPEFGPVHLRPLWESHARPFGIKIKADPYPEPWLAPGADWVRFKYRRALIARSHRYHGQCDWAAEVDRLRKKYDDVAFVGLESEAREFGHDLPWIPTSNALELAKVIYESRRLSCNQSFPLALALGYGVPVRIEIAPGHNQFPGADAIP